MRKGWRLLGSHRLAAALMALTGLAAAIGGTLPQAPRQTAEELDAWQRAWGFAATALDALGLTNLFATPWFWGLCVLLLANLAAGMVQLALRTSSWRTPRPWGVLAGHAGLCLIVGGGMGSALTGFGAHLELTEGEAWHGEPGKLVTDRGRSGPFPAALRLDRIAVELGEGARLRTLRLGLGWQEQGGTPQQGEVAANRPVIVAGYRVLPANTFGHSAVLERRLPDGERRILLVNFPVPRAQWGAPRWEAERSHTLESRGRVRYYAFRLEGEPVRLRMTVNRGAQALFDDWLRPGETVAIEDERVTLHPIRPWAGLYLASDRGAPWVFAGMVLAVGGFLLALAAPRPRREGEAS